jgi:hypothetical protein
LSEQNRNLPESRKETAVTTRRIKRQETKSDRFIKFAKRFFAQFGTAIMAVAIVAYVFLQLMLNVSVNLDRETAAYVKITDRAELSAFLFRDEYLIPQGAEGTDCFLVEDGEKVRYGQDIVVTYSDENDVKLQKRISEIDKRIDILKRSSLTTGASTTDITLIDGKINELILSIARQVDENDFDKVLREKEELLILMNRRQALTHSDDYRKELIELENEKRTLSNQLSGANYTVQSPKSGYFYSSVDGYENSFTLDVLEGLTGEGFEKLSESTPDKSLIAQSSGKIVMSSTWYIAVAVNKRTAETFTEGKSYPITFQYSNNTVLNMKLERRITRTDKDSTVLVLSTKVMPEGFDYSRCQTVELPTTVHEGIRINNNAIRMQDGEIGVYVVVGSKVVFKKTTVIYNYGSYAVCAIPKNPAYPNRHDVAYSSKTELSLHDSVIISGDDLYDGKRLK